MKKYNRTLIMQSVMLTAVIFFTNSASAQSADLVENLNFYKIQILSKAFFLKIQCKDGDRHTYYCRDASA